MEMGLGLLGSGQDEDEPLGWRGSGMATITGQALTIGGNQIKKITTAAQHNAGWRRTAPFALARPA